MQVEFRNGVLSPPEQEAVTEGFRQHTETRRAPAYRRQALSWIGRGQDGEVIAALTAEVLWDWLYIDEIWVDAGRRGAGLGRQLMQRVESHARREALQGIWLWTQSWQAEDFYRRLGYREFTRFDDFPRGHRRIGFRKSLVAADARATAGAGAAPDG
mgnify:CR=1 FL=1